MKTELQRTLIAKYPMFFSYLGNKKIIERLCEIKDLREQEETVIPMQFGIECHDGWFWLLDELMGTIYKYCEDNSVTVPDVAQIKEKWGRLCFYINGGNQLIDGMIWLAEHMSKDICEKCGTTENVGQTEGWVYTICESCREKDPRAKELKWNKNI